MTLNVASETEGTGLRPSSSPAAGWPMRRWLIAILSVFVIQLGLIFGLSDRTPLSIRMPASGSVSRLAVPESSEALALQDPTLFALPHRQSFAGPAWMIAPPLPSKSFAWNEEPRWLALNAGELGTVFNRFVITNDFDGVPMPVPPPPTMTLASVNRAKLESPSALRVEGDLGHRRLLKELTLRPWANGDLLTNTVIQMVVNAEGRPTSLVQLSSSGSAEADRYAFEQALGARFAALPESSPEKPSRSWEQLTFGKLIFEWQTIPSTGTNAPAARP